MAAPKVFVAQSEIKGAGLGLFALEAIKKGTLIAEYKGQVLSESEFKKRYATKEPAYVLDIGSKIIDAVDAHGSPARYANHAPPSRANANFTKTGWLKSVKAIRAGSEILADYGPAYWRGRKKSGKKTGAKKAARKR